MKKILLFIAILLGLSSVPLLAQGPNMSKYITLTVQSGKPIKLDFLAKQDNTPVRVVSGIYTQDIVVGTDWYSRTESDFITPSSSTTMTVYGDISGFTCADNRGNLLSLYTHKNPDLEELYCYNNHLTELSLRKNTALKIVECYNNNFSTEALNDLYCSLPNKEGEAGKCFVANKATDTKHDEIILATSQLARAKNWQVKYYNDGNATGQSDVPGYGNYSCKTTNESKYIILTVVNEQNIKLNFKSKKNDTPVRIVSGNTVKEIFVDNDWYSTTTPNTFSVTAQSNTMIVYGDITGFDCSDNGENVTAVYSNKNEDLTQLYCNNNKLTYLNLRNNTSLEEVQCFNNAFTTQALNNIYCSLPTVQGTAGKFFVANLTTDNNYSQITEASAANARSKNWQVKLYNNGTAAGQNDIPSTTPYLCPATPNNMNRYITLTVNDNKVIKLNFKATTDNSVIRLESGNEIQNITAGTAWLDENLNFTSNGNIVTIYGDIEAFSCSDNGANLTAVDLIKMTTLKEFYGRNNNISNLDVSKNTLLTKIDCANNAITALNLKENVALTELYCNNNRIASLDFSNTPAIKTIVCYDNPLTTVMTNNLYCSLPTVNGEAGKLFICNTNLDTRFDDIVAATSNNARNKNWKVKFYGEGVLANQFDVPNNGNYNCANTEFENKITLNVENGQVIKIDVKAEKENTPVRIISGNSVKEINVGTDWYNTTHQTNKADFLANGTTITIAGNFSALDCSGNVNNVTAINLSEHLDITELNCSNNKIAALDLSNNAGLVKLDCSKNLIPALNLSANPAIKYIACYKNLLTTQSANEIYCSLPAVVGSDAGKLFVLDSATGENNANIVAATSKNARDKNWEVKYYNGGYLPQDDVQNTGMYNCAADLSTYITLTVQPKKEIKLNFRGVKPGTPIRVVSGEVVKDYTISSSWYTELNNHLIVNSGNQATTMTIYGQIAELNCSNNNTNITAIDLSHNALLTGLYCSNNAITALDLRNNDLLTSLHCYGNAFTTDAVNNLYCSLPIVVGTDARCYILNSTADDNHDQIVAANSNNARAKNWIVKYYTTKNDVPSNGNNTCPSSVNLNRKITLNVKNGIPIKLNFKGATINTPVRIVSGTTTKDIVVGTNWYQDINNNTFSVMAAGDVMTIHGDITGLICANNTTNITGINTTENRLLTSLDCSNNQIDTIDVSKNKYLAELNISKNIIRGINLRNNTKLATFNCNNNTIERLVLTANTKLTHLYCSANRIDSLNLSENNNLKEMSCASNRLSNLNISSNRELTFLYINNNSIKTIDFSKNTKLKHLDCSWNKLDTIYLGKNKELTHLYCDNNKLHNLYLKDNVNLKTVQCFENNFSTEEANNLYCSLPEIIGDPGKLFAINTDKDANFPAMIEATSDNARAKNWEVKYYNNGATQQDDIASNGSFSCYAVNLNRYITFTLDAPGDVSLYVKAFENNTPIRIVSGTTSTDYTVDTDAKTINFRATDKTVTVYGNIASFNCDGNRVTDIDISNNNTLTTLSCANNAIVELNVRNNKDLTELNCSYNQLTTLDVRENENLTRLYANRNQLTVLNTNYNKELVEFNCSNNKIDALELNNNTKLMKVLCSDNELKVLDMIKNTELRELHCYNNPFTTDTVNALYCSLPSRKAQAMGVCYTLNAETDANHAAVVAANSDNARNKNWEVKYLSNGEAIPSNGDFSCATKPVSTDKYIRLTVKKGTTINFNLIATENNAPIRVLSGSTKKDFTIGTEWRSAMYSFVADSTVMTIYGELEGFICSNQKENITGISTKNSEQLKYLDVEGNAISTLDLSNNTMLERLDCHLNQLTSLDLSKNTMLKSLSCYSNQLTSLDVSNNTMLESLGCSSNQLTSLDVSNNTMLERLDCHLNQLTSLDLSKNTMLKSLSCYSNQLTSLDVNNNTMLERLDCSNNQLTSLDLSKNTMLEDLYCSNNQLTSLDLSKNTMLKELYCSSNQLTSLDVNNNTMLERLYCYSNQLTSLDLSNNVNLVSVHCYNNLFTTEAVNELYCSLPNRDGMNQGAIFPLRSQTDANYAAVVAATSDNARDKHWEVQYGNFTDIPSSGNYVCPNTGVKHITINVKNGKDIKLNFKAAEDKEKIRLESGNTITELTIGKDWYSSTYPSSYSFTSNSNKITIFGNVTALDCSNNGANVTGVTVFNNKDLEELNCSKNEITAIVLASNGQLKDLDLGDNKVSVLNVSENPKLEYLSCENNQLTILDLGANPELKKVWCYGNLFNTEAVNELYCSVIDMKGATRELFPLNTANDENHLAVVAATSDNARKKNWNVKYFNNGFEPQEQIQSNGFYSCDTASRVNPNNYITLYVKQGKAIKLDFKAAHKKTAIRIENGPKPTHLVINDTWHNGNTPSKYTVTSLGTVIKIYGDVVQFRCSDNDENVTGVDISNNQDLTYLACAANNITTLDVSKNPKLRELHCYKNNISTLELQNNRALVTLSCYYNSLNKLDLSKNANLQYLDCGGNKLDTLDLTNTTRLIDVRCYNNNLTELNLTQNSKLVNLDFRGNQIQNINLDNNTELENLYCFDNKLTSLNLSYNVNLKSILCYGNPMNTDAINELYCSLPIQTDTSKLDSNRVCYPINMPTDANAAEVIAATSDNARAKVWNIKYWSNKADVVSSGDYNCNKQEPKANMKTYVTLIVKKGKTINFNFKAAKQGTPVRIASGNRTQDLMVGDIWNYRNYSFTADADTMTIYGDITDFVCYNNRTNLSGLDVSNNTLLQFINCSNNNISSLDVRNNIALRRLLCFSNPFTTFSLNALYCSLPIRPAELMGECISINTTTEPTHATLVAATSDNAREKNWKVMYNINKQDVPSNGNFNCNSGIDDTMASGISVFPNPAETKVQILLDTKVNEMLILVDISGRALLTAEVVEGKATIDVSNLTTGTYFIKVGDRVQKLTVK